MNDVRVDVIIPLYRPGKELFVLLDRLLLQTLLPNRILLVNTEKKYFDELVSEREFREKYAPRVLVTHIKKSEFDHGGTRHLAVERSDADYFVMMTQDALPADGRLLERLVAALRDETVAVAYARQLPKKNSTKIERFMRRFNYPDVSRVKYNGDLGELGIKTYFCSNVCAAYRRSVYLELGGFIRHTIFNEDMVFAAKAAKHGYGIAYAADARVFHSHNYTCLEQFKRNFDLGVSQEDHPEVFAGLSSEGEGKRMVKEATVHLARRGKPFLIPYFYLQSACKYAGYLLGRHYKKLPAPMIRLFTSNRAYWEQ